MITVNKPMIKNAGSLGKIVHDLDNKGAKEHGPIINVWND